MFLKNRAQHIGTGVAVFMAVLFTYCGVALATSGAAQTPTLDSQVDVDRPIVLQGDDSPLYLLIRFHAEEHAHANRPRPLVNLGLVLDRSGSMADAGKIEFLKKAASMVVDRLTRRDYLSVVEYDDVITLLWPSAPVEASYPIKQLIASLEPRGSTDLVGGMMRGADEVLARREQLTGEGIIHRVLLLSDGLANQGVTDPREIARLVRAAKEKGARISTIGLGRDYDEDLMQAIAENGGGNYYFVEHPNQMARIFEHELETLFTTVAKDVELHFRPSAHIRKVEVVSLDAARAEDASRIELENFYAGEDRALVLRVEPAAGAFASSGSTIDIGRFELSYVDIETGQVASLVTPVAVTVSTDEAAISAAKNHDVIVETQLVEAERRHSDALKEYEAGNFDKANALMTSLEKDIAERNDDLQDVRLKQKMEAVQVERDQMASAETVADDRAVFLKGSKQRLYQAQMGKRALYVLQVGDKGLEVERLQEALASAGYYEGPVDGLYSAEVSAAVEAYQADKSLGADGVAGPATMQSLGLY